MATEGLSSWWPLRTPAPWWPLRASAPGLLLVLPCARASVRWERGKEGRKEGTHCQGFQFLPGNRDLLLLNSSHLLSHCLDSCALVVFVQITAAVALVPGFVPLLANKAFPLTLYEFCSQPEAPSLCWWNISWLHSDGSCLEVHLLQDIRATADSTVLPATFVLRL